MNSLAVNMHRTSGLKKKKNSVGTDKIFSFIVSPSTAN